MLFKEEDCIIIEDIDINEVKRQLLEKHDVLDWHNKCTLPELIKKGYDFKIKLHETKKLYRIGEKRTLEYCSICNNKSKIKFTLRVGTEDYIWYLLLSCYFEQQAIYKLKHDGLKLECPNLHTTRKYCFSR